MPRQSGRRERIKEISEAKRNGKTHKRADSVWTPQQRGSAKAWLEKLGYTPDTLRCRTLADMSEAEIAAIESEYGAKVLRPIPGRKGERARVRAVAISHPKPPDQWAGLLDCDDVISEEVELQD